MPPPSTVARGAGDDEQADAFARDLARTLDGLRRRGNPVLRCVKP